PVGEGPGTAVRPTQSPYALWPPKAGRPRLRRDLTGCGWAALPFVPRRRDRSPLPTRSPAPRTWRRCASFTPSTPSTLRRFSEVRCTRLRRLRSGALPEFGALPKSGVRCCSEVPERGQRRQDAGECAAHRVPYRQTKWARVECLQVL